MTKKRILIWYRNDLRLHDCEPLYNALEQKAQIIPFYCFDSRDYGKTSYGFPKTGSYRAQFIIESVTDLRNSLQQLSSNLIIRQGLPEIVIPEIVKQLKIDLVYYHEEVTTEELAVETELDKLGVDLVAFWGATLHHIDDLPFEISNTPEIYTQFRKQVEKSSIVNPPFPPPKTLPQLPEIEPGAIPKIAELGLEPPVYDERAALHFQGGESAGKARLEQYLWQENLLKDYKQTRNKMLGADYSSKFSPWLARGCLSPRYIYEKVQKYERERVKNDSTYWLIFELRWRDYFRFICSKHGNKVFYQSGIKGLDIDWKEDWERFTLWQAGKTGFPLVDANMREISATGFMSNRGRQNVASFLTKNLGINWQMGAEWFESLLIDYDVCSNWGNWNYVAGVGNDARGFRFFNIIKQSKDYDPEGKYLRHWLPELASLPAKKIHEPWQLSREEQSKFGVILGVDYPQPVVNLFKSAKANEKIYNAAANKVD
ncbi:DASH family cryptochrome [Oscillatoria salina]|uniref:DASH family cryptochrome n=1 Tax=Oscillatoria salina TaxID=331517 RepID=UPI0013B740BB|nr:DASH family cryptochrome [Oscillatoria salina]MBZ8180195.1 DASH family cryptochrome [Oscillatoria salina IIICB1]NET90269.1 DASH family cryptochrome [Kamptonema sp. SIO1D9]